MARKRMLSPGFFSDERVCSVSPLARLMFQWMWCAADRAGRLEDRPMKLKFQALPNDACDGETLVAELARVGLVRRYTVGDRRLLLIPNLTKHQVFHVREPASKLPPPPTQLRAVSADSEKCLHESPVLAVGMSGAGPGLTPVGQRAGRTESESESESKSIAGAEADPPLPEVPDDDPPLPTVDDDVRPHVAAPLTLVRPQRAPEPPAPTPPVLTPSPAPKARKTPKPSRQVAFHRRAMPERAKLTPYSDEAWGDVELNSALKPILNEWGDVLTWEAWLAYLADEKHRAARWPFRLWLAIHRQYMRPGTLSSPSQDDANVIRAGEDPYADE